MAILSAMQSAQLRVLGQKPQTFFGSQNLAEQEMCDWVNEVANDIVQYQDWGALTKFASLTGNGTQVDFMLPADFGRMTLASEIQQSSPWGWGYRSVRDLNAFRYLSDTGWGPYPGVWSIFGGLAHFTPAPTGNSTYPYVSAFYARDAGTATPKAAFTADTDEFLLPERLLTLGLVWRWRENKKLDATGDQEAFVKALDEYASKDRGSNVYRQSSRRVFPGTYPAWPGLLGP